MATSLKKNKLQGDFTGAIFNVRRFMSPVQKMKDRRGEMYFLWESPAGNGRVNTYDCFNKIRQTPRSR